MVCALCAGCASEGTQPSGEMVRARTMVEQADKAGAQRYPDAAADLQRAHDELSNADLAITAKKYDDARRYAENAAADAELASARSSAGDAMRASHETMQGNETLREEGYRGQSRQPSPDTPMSPGSN
jgi:hypothetical protein